MTRENICAYETGRGEKGLCGWGKIGKQIKKLLLLFALVVALCGAYGYAEDNIFLFSIDGNFNQGTDEDGFIRSNEDTGEGGSIRVGAGESDDRTFIAFVSFDTTSLAGKTITGARIVLTVQNDNIWGNADPFPDQFGAFIDLSPAFSGDKFLQVPGDRDAAATVEDCAVDAPWGMQGKNKGERVEIQLLPSAIAAINTSGRTQFRINSGTALGEQNEAMDFYDGSAIGMNRPILWINPNGPIIPFPILTEVVADDPDNDYGALSNGDTLTLVFDMNTNSPLAGTKAQIDGLIDFGGKSLGTNYTGVWTDATTLAITVVDATGGNLAIGDTIAIKADGTSDLKNQAQTSPASTTSGEVSGDWGPLPPQISAAAASDPDNDNSALNNGDMLTVIFDVDTNTPPAASKAQIDGLIDFGTGKSLGTNYTGVWTDPNMLAITVVDATGGNLAIGDTIAIKADGTNDLKNAAQTSLASTSSAAVTGYWGPSVKNLYLGLNDVASQGPALAHVKFDPSAAPGSRYTLGAVELQEAKVSLIEVDSKGGQGGGIYIAIKDDSDPNGNYLKEYRSDEAEDFILLRKSREDLTDMAISPADYGLYGFEKTVGGIVRFDPNDTTFRHSGETGNDEVGNIGEVAIGVDGYVHCNFYESDRNRLENFTYNEETNAFTARDMKDQEYKIDELIMSPRDNTVTWDNELEKNGTIEQNAYTSYHHVGDGYVTVCESPDGIENPEWAMPGISDLAMLSDGTVIAVDMNSHILAYDGKIVLMGWAPDPHTITQGSGQMSLVSSVEIGEGVTDPNLSYHLAVDEENTVHVFGGGVLRAFRINPNEQTFDAVESLAIGAGTEIAASVYKNPPLPPLGTVYDLYEDFTLDNDQMIDGNWQYMDPLGVLLVNDDGPDVHTYPYLCDSDAWYYNSAGGPPGPWGFGDYWFVPWLNQATCHGGRPGEVLFYGPLKIRWTAPEAGDNVEISGHLWQINYDQMNTGGTQLTYAIYLNDDEIASGGVEGNEDGTLENRDNTVRFDDGDDDSKIVIPHLAIGDTVSLLLEGYAEDPNAYGYASFQIVIPKCYYGLIGDLDKNCTVDIVDLGIMAANWLTEGEPDYFDDSSVNLNDFAMLAGEWLTDCRETDCVPFMESIDSEDGFIRSDGDMEAVSVRIGDDGEGRTFNSILSFDTRVLQDVPITRAWIGLTVKNREIWSEGATPDPDQLNITLDLCAAFNNDTSLESPVDFDVIADVIDCAVEDDWGLTEAAVDEQILIELNAAAIDAINSSGRTQFRINTGFSDDVEPYDVSQADAIDFYDGGDGPEKSPILIVE